MGRDGSGNAWRYRQTRPHGLSGIPRNYTVRKLNVEPQFQFDELYITPFRFMRQYNENSTITYVAIERKMEPTGIHIFDAYLKYLAAGQSELKTFAKQYGLRREDIDSLVFILTGMRGVDFRMKFQVLMADQLLRFTDMSVAEVSKRAGFGSANNLYLTYKREFNLAPGYRRQNIRQEGDLGRYKL